jgi:uncharacterized protein YggE
MKPLFVLALLVPAVLPAQQLRDSVISASASRMTTAVPDRATGYVVVEGTGEIPLDANARLDTKMKAVMDALRAVSSHTTADRPVSYGVGHATNPSGFQNNVAAPTFVSRSIIRVHMSRLDQMSAAIGSLLAAGATSVTGIQYESSSIDSLRREKIAEALTIARTDAQALATALGGKLGALVDVTSSSTSMLGVSPQIVIDQRYFGGSGATPSVSFNTNVSVRYRLVR